MSLLKKVWNRELWQARVDSPWFWFMLYGNFAILGLLIIGPKYTKRQGNVETAYAGRQEAARRKLDPSGERPADVDPTEVAQTLKVPLWPLGLGLSFVVTGVGIWQLNRRPQKEPSP